MTLRWHFFALYLALLTFFLGGPSALAYTPPPLTGAVNDGASLLTPGERSTLESRLKVHRDAHGDEIVVFTVPSLGGESIEDVAYGTFNAWKIGQKGKDNGVLLVIAPKERKTRIETGKGVGDKITDLQSKQILSERVGPRLKEGKNYEGIAAGVESIASLLTGGPLVPPGEAPRPSSRKPDPPRFEPSSAFVDATGTFPAAERARFLTAYEARKKQGKAAFAVVVVDDGLAGELPGICGYNLAAFTRALPSVKGIVVTTRSGSKLSEYSGSDGKGPGVVALSQAITALAAALPRAGGEARDKALVDGLVKALDGYDMEMPGLFDRMVESPVGMLVFVIFLLVLLIWIGTKFAPSGGGGGGSSSGSSWSSDSSDSSSSSSSWSSGGDSGYSGGGGSSGGGGASDDY
jgi:uncharacterized membrane protein YgcG